MTDERICPVMSRPKLAIPIELDTNEFDDLDMLDRGMYHNGVVLCQREKCMAWMPECPSDVICDDGENADKCKRKSCGEYCKFIERGKQ